MKNIAVITARSGSKGLPDKNIKLLNNMPLMAYSIQAAIKSGCYDTVMVSTDSQKYKNIALKYGAEVPFLRSTENSLDHASSWDCVIEVLQNYQQLGKKFDSVTLLQPTSPLRNEKHIQEGYALMEEKHADSITAVCEMDHSPLWANTLPEDLSMINFEDEEVANLPRQQLPTFYRINGALYIRKIKYDDVICLGNCSPFAYIMDKKFSIDIDTDLDFLIAEITMQKCR